MERNVGSILQQGGHQQSYFFWKIIVENKNLLPIGKGRLKTVKPWKCVSNDIVFARSKVNVRIVMFIIAESVYYMVLSGIVTGNDKVVSVNVELTISEHCAEFEHNHYNGDKFLVSNCILQLFVIQFVWPDSHRFVILDNVCSHLVAGSISIDVKRFAVI